VKNNTSTTPTNSSSSSSRIDNKCKNTQHNYFDVTITGYLQPSNILRPYFCICLMLLKIRRRICLFKNKTAFQEQNGSGTMQIAGGHVSWLVVRLKPAPAFEEIRREGQYARSAPGGRQVGDDRVR
jgi:hypothetical protein